MDSIVNDIKTSDLSDKRMGVWDWVKDNFHSNKSEESETEEEK